MTRTREELDAAVAEITAEVASSIEAGILPDSVASFSELHDHMDANELGGFTDPDSRANWDTFDHIRVQAGVDTWLLARIVPPGAKEDARSIAAAVAFGRRVAALAPLGADGLRLGDVVGGAILDAGGTVKRCNEAGVEAGYRLKQRQAIAHANKTWCPNGATGCYYCRPVA